MVAVEAIKKALWLRGVMSELDFDQGTVEFYYDNQSRIHLSRNP